MVLLKNMQTTRFLKICPNVLHSPRGRTNVLCLEHRQIWPESQHLCSSSGTSDANDNHTLAGLVERADTPTRNGSRPKLGRLRVDLGRARPNAGRSRPRLREGGRPNSGEFRPDTKGVRDHTLHEGSTTRVARVCGSPSGAGWAVPGPSATKLGGVALTRANSRGTQ